MEEKKMKGGKKRLLHNKRQGGIKKSGTEQHRMYRENTENARVMEECLRNKVQRERRTERKK